MTNDELIIVRLKTIETFIDLKRLSKERGILDDSAFHIGNAIKDIKAVLNHPEQPSVEVDVDYLNKKIEFHYCVMTHGEHSEIVKQQSESAYHALCDIRHNLSTQNPTTDEKRVMDLMAEALDGLWSLSIQRGNPNYEQSNKLKETIRNALQEHAKYKTALETIVCDREVLGADGVYKTAKDALGV